MLIFDLVERESGSLCAGFWTWIVSLVSIPGVIYSTQIYPEALACLLVLVLLRGLLLPQTRYSLVAFIIAAVSLPWLKPRYALLSLPLVAMFLLFALARRDRGGKEGLMSRLKMTPVLVMLGSFVSLAVVLLLYKSILFRFFGAMNVEDILHLDWSNCLWRLFAVFLDARHGLLFYSPVFLFSILGLLLLLASRHKAGDIGVCCAAPYLFALGAVGWWFGGGCPPGRYLVCLLPFFLLWMGIGLAMARGLIYRASFLMLLVWTIAASVVMTLFPSYRYVSLQRESSMAADLFRLPEGVIGLLPSFVTRNAASYVSIVLAAIVVAFLFLANRKPRPSASSSHQLSRISTSVLEAGYDKK